MGKPRLLALLVAALVRTATAGVISCPSSGGSLRSTEADGRVSIDGTDFGSSDYATCTFVIGNGTAGRLQLSDLRVDFDSGVGLWLYGEGYIVGFFSQTREDSQLGRIHRPSDH